jgi:hypothetical protein
MHWLQVRQHQRLPHWFGLWGSGLVMIDTTVQSVHATTALHAEQTCQDSETITEQHMTMTDDHDRLIQQLFSMS